MLDLSLHQPKIKFVSHISWEFYQMWTIYKPEFLLLFLRNPQSKMSLHLVVSQLRLYKLIDIFVLLAILIFDLNLHTFLAIQKKAFQLISKLSPLFLFSLREFIHTKCRRIKSKYKTYSWHTKQHLPLTCRV